MHDTDGKPILNLNCNTSKLVPQPKINRNKKRYSENLISKFNTIENRIKEIKNIDLDSIDLDDTGICIRQEMPKMNKKLGIPMKSKELEKS
jgi:hypothetical protein